MARRYTDSAFEHWERVRRFSIRSQSQTDIPLANGESLEVSYLHLANSKPILAYFLTNAPTAMLEIFDDVAMDAVLIYYPNYLRVKSEIHVRISEIPLTVSLRDLRRTQLNQLVRVSGVVTRRRGVFPVEQPMDLRSGTVRAAKQRGTHAAVSSRVRCGRIRNDQPTWMARDIKGDSRSWSR